MIFDRPESKKPAYFAGFFGDFDFGGADFLCGSGGVFNIRRNTSSGLGGGSFFMEGV